jgi:transcriptional regulator with XRE-family HTH domain
MARPRRQSNFQGARLRLARQELNWSQAELGVRLQVHRATLIRWESNLSAPSEEQEELLATILARPREWFHLEFDSPSGQKKTLSLEEKVEILLRRVGRIEKALGQVLEHLRQRD